MVKKDDASAYRDPQYCPRNLPALKGMELQTQTLHQQVDDAARATRTPSLSAEAQSVTFDLFATRNIVEWQESKAEAVFSDTHSWFELAPIYGRYGVPELQAYGAGLGTLYEAPPALPTCSGMAAVTTVFESLIDPGTHIILMGQVYNKSRSLLELMSQRLGAELSFVPYNDVSSLQAVLGSRPTLFFAETFTNPHMRALDVPTIRDVLNRNPASVMAVDDTIATPWGTRRSLLDAGVDVVVGSGTKALSGNDSSISGYIVSKRGDILNACMNTLAMRGGLLDATTATKLGIGLQRARARHIQRARTTSILAEFLDGHPKVQTVYHPGLASHPDHAIAQRDYRHHGALLSFRLMDESESVCKRVCDALAMTGVFRYALSFDGLVSKVNHHRSVSEYFTPEAVCKEQNIHSLIRLGIGLEASGDLLACLNWALWHGAEVSVEEHLRWEQQRRVELNLDQ